MLYSADAEAELERLRRRLEGFDAEARELVAVATEAAEGERSRALERAAAAAERLRGEARRVADQEVKRARQELRAEAAELATALAGEILREVMTPDDDKRLVNDFIDRVGETDERPGDGA